MELILFISVFSASYCIFSFNVSFYVQEEPVNLPDVAEAYHDLRVFSKSVFGVQ